MASRLDLEEELKRKLGSNNVYYQPPSKMNYPGIKYTKEKIESTFANDKKYRNVNKYQVIIMSVSPDHPVIMSILQMPMSSYDRHYVKDGLNHDVITLYY